MLIIELFICIIIADFITGLGHWLEDTYGVLTWPSPLKEGVVIPNIEHHKNPSIFGRMTTFFSRNWHVMAPMFVIAAVALFFGFWHIGLILILAAFGNEVHAWSHKGKNNFLVAFLQDSAIIQTPAQHARHHMRPYDKYYCTLTNVTNAFLELINFWRILEHILLTVFGLKVKRLTEERLGY